MKSLDSAFQLYRSQNPWQEMWVSLDLVYRWKKQKFK